MAEMPGVSAKSMERACALEISPRVGYCLKAKGKSLISILCQMGKWGMANLKERLGLEALQAGEA
jgi:DNA-binding HxlR family transcriptional regulator